MHIFVAVAALLFFMGVIVWAFMENPKQQIGAVWENFTATLAVSQQDYAVLLSSWAQEALNDDVPLQSWLLSLPAESLQALGEKIHEFSLDMDLDLRWLIEQEFSSAPETQSMIVDYCKLCMKAVQHQQ